MTHESRREGVEDHMRRLSNTRRPGDRGRHRVHRVASRTCGLAARARSAPPSASSVQSPVRATTRDVPSQAPPRAQTRSSETKLEFRI